MQKILSVIKTYTDKRFSTIAGTLVYFLLMSIAPFILWLTLVFGNVNVDQALSSHLLDSISPVLGYLKNSAESAVSGAGIVFLATSLYSSTNFFYHLRRSGEIIYESDRVKGGIKLRLVSIVLIALTLIMVAVSTWVTVAGKTFLNRFLPDIFSQIISAVFITDLTFGVAVALNYFACPYKLKLKEVLWGSFITTVLWIIFAIGFGVYAKFAKPERLYGKIASVIIFLLWCYVMMCCFVIGMINNGQRKIRPNVRLKHKRTELGIKI